jgi:hypothetical protein
VVARGGGSALKKFGIVPLPVMWRGGSVGPGRFGMAKHNGERKGVEMKEERQWRKDRGNGWTKIPRQCISLDAQCRSTGMMYQSRGKFPA